MRASAVHEYGSINRPSVVTDLTPNSAHQSYLLEHSQRKYNSILELTKSLGGEIVSRLNDYHRTIVIYNGNGVASQSAEKLQELFFSIGLQRENWDIRVVDTPNRLLEQILLLELSETICVFPGGNASGYDSSLKHYTPTLQEHLEGGMSYLFICASFYWTSSLSVYPQDGEPKKREWEVFKGISIGPRIPKVMEGRPVVLSPSVVDWQGRLKLPSEAALTTLTKSSSSIYTPKSIFSHHNGAVNAAAMSATLFEHRITPVKLYYGDMIVDGDSVVSGGGTFTPHPHESSLYRTLVRYDSMDKDDDPAIAVVKRDPQGDTEGICIGSSLHPELEPDELEKYLANPGFRSQTPTTAIDLENIQTKYGGYETMNSFNRCMTAALLENLVDEKDFL